MMQEDSMGFGFDKTQNPPDNTPLNTQLKGCIQSLH